MRFRAVELGTSVAQRTRDGDSFRDSFGANVVLGNWDGQLRGSTHAFDRLVCAYPRVLHGGPTLAWNARDGNSNPARDAFLASLALLCVVACEAGSPRDLDAHGSELCAPSGDDVYERALAAMRDVDPRVLEYVDDPVAYTDETRSYLLHVRSGIYPWQRLNPAALSGLGPASNGAWNVADLGTGAGLLPLEFTVLARKHGVTARILGMDRELHPDLAHIPHPWLPAKPMFIEGDMTDPDDLRALCRNFGVDEGPCLDVAIAGSTFFTQNARLLRERHYDHLEDEGRWPYGLHRNTTQGLELLRREAQNGAYEDGTGGLLRGFRAVRDVLRPGGQLWVGLINCPADGILLDRYAAEAGFAIEGGYVRANVDALPSALVTDAGDDPFTREVVESVYAFYRAAVPEAETLSEQIEEVMAQTVFEIAMFGGISFDEYQYRIYTRMDGPIPASSND